jgi:hypothetical protein
VIRPSRLRGANALAVLGRVRGVIQVEQVIANALAHHAGLRLGRHNRINAPQGASMGYAAQKTTAELIEDIVGTPAASFPQGAQPRVPLDAVVESRSALRLGCWYIRCLSCWYTVSSSFFRL